MQGAIEAAATTMLGGATGCSRLDDRNLSASDVLARLAER